MTRLRVKRVPIIVTVDPAGIPQSFYWQGELHIVEGVANHWVVDKGWWFRRIARENFKVYTNRRLVIIYRDLIDAHWYLVRVYD